MQNPATNQEPSSAADGSPVTRDWYEQVMTPNYAPMSMMPSHGCGSRLWDTDGRGYLDFAGGIAVSALGHAHPDLVSVLTEQARRFWHVSNVLTNQPALALARRLCDMTFAGRVFLANSGSEANEAALKLARRYAVNTADEDKYEILAFENAFHGRTLFTVSVGGQPAYSSGFGPKPGGISHVPFNDSDAVRSWFEKVGERACAVIVEPCQGEGGVTPATAGFIETLRDCCDRYKALLIFDEIQTGVGRSGYLYTYEKLGVVPDILTTAKALGCGFPVSAMLTTDEIGAHLVIGAHGSTFGGNPMACAVACRALDLINTKELLDNVKARSRQIVDGIHRINRRHDVFRDVRGSGLLLGCELNDRHSGRARDLLTACTDNGLLALVAGSSVLRLAPPLNISESETREGLDLLDLSVERFLGDGQA